MSYAAANPDNKIAQRTAASVSDGYRRAMAPELLAMMNRARLLKSDPVGGISLAALLTRSLAVESDRSHLVEQTGCHET